jgi:hypothetical protein
MVREDEHEQRLCKPESLATKPRRAVEARKPTSREPKNEGKRKKQKDERATVPVLGGEANTSARQTSAAIDDQIRKATGYDSATIDGRNTRRGLKGEQKDIAKIYFLPQKPAQKIWGKFCWHENSA